MAKERYWDNPKNVPEYDPSFKGICGGYIDKSETYSVFSLINFNKVKTFLDSGCGTGRHLINLPKYVEAYGIDASKYMIKVAKKKVKNVKFYVSEVEKTNFKDNYFDCIISVRVLQHLENQEKSIEEMIRTLKKNGRLIVMNYNKITLLSLYKWIRQHKIRKMFSLPFDLLIGKSPFGRWKQPLDTYNTYGEIKRMFEKNGLKVKRIRGSVIAQAELFGFFGITKVPIIKGLLPGLFRIAYKFEKKYGHLFPFNRLAGRIVVEGIKL